MIDSENHGIFWLRTSLSMTVDEEAGGEAGVAGFFDDQCRRGTDREFVEFAGRGAVGKARDRAGGHPHRVDAEQAFGGPGDGVDDAVDVDGLEGSVAFPDPHPRRCIDR